MLLTYLMPYKILLLASRHTHVFVVLVLIFCIMFRSTGYSYTSYKVSSSKRITTGDNCKLSDLEHVEVEISFSYTRKRGAVKLYLESPAGTKSHLMTPRPQDSVKYPWSGSKRWYYTSVHYWGESVDGTWILTAESDEPYSVQGIQHLKTTPIQSKSL